MSFLTAWSILNYQNEQKKSYCTFRVFRDSHIVWYCCDPFPFSCPARTMEWKQTWSTAVTPASRPSPTAATWRSTRSTSTAARDCSPAPPAQRPSNERRMSSAIKDRWGCTNQFLCLKVKFRSILLIKYLIISFSPTPCCFSGART